MTQHRRLATGLAAALTASLALAGPATVVAQDDESVTPEGVEWTLSTYLDPQSEELVRVPYGVEATLLLREGVASGSGGCNQFNGSYLLDGSSLRFGGELSVTLALCEDDVQRVEDAYLAALGDVDGWMIDAGTLELSDDFGEIVLTFEVPSILWTAGQMTELMTRLDDSSAELEAARREIETLRDEIETLRGDLEGENIDRLRKRLRNLEADNTETLERLDALEEQPAANTQEPGATSFTNAEQVLLEGVPARIANTCSPLRSSLPRGTRAAVSCRPNSSTVASLNYYLLEGDAAATAFGDVMATFNVPDATSASDTCEQGVKSQRYWVGGGWQAEGCYRANQRAELRFVDNATDCRTLKVGNRRLQSPAFYIELQGSDNDVARLHAWATKNVSAGSSQLTSMTRPIKRPNASLSPSCPT